MCLSTVTCSYLYYFTNCTHSTGLHSATTYTVSAIANEPAPKKMRSSPIDVSRLKSRYLRQLPTAKSGWPKHKVTEFVRLALIQKEDVTLKDNDLNEVTKLTLQGDVDRILKKKVPLANLREIFRAMRTNLVLD